MEILLACDVVVRLLSGEFGGVGDGLLGVGVEAAEAAGAGFADDAGGVERAAGEDHGGEQQSHGVLRCVDGDLADAIAVVVAGIDVGGVGEAGANLIGAAGVDGLVERDEGDGVLTAVDEGLRVASEPGVGGGIFDVEVLVGVGEDGYEGGPLVVLGEDVSGGVEGAGLDDLLGGRGLLGPVRA